MSADGLVLHGDARAEATALLKAGLTGRPEPFLNGLRIAGNFNGTMPSISVNSDGVTESTYPIVDGESLRVTCWTAKDAFADAHDLARLARAVLLLGTSGQLTCCLPGTGPFDTVDDQTGNPMSWFTVIANMQGRISA